MTRLSINQNSPVTGLSSIPITPILPLEIKNMVWCQFGYVPSSTSLPFHRSEAHQRVIYGGWRGGKSFTAAMEMVPLVRLWQDKNRTDEYAGILWIIGPEFYQARAEFKYMRWAFEKLGILDEKSLSMPKDGRWSMTTTTGWLIETQSSRHMEALGSVTVNAIIVAEAGQHDPSIMTWVLGRAAEAHGPIVYSGTLEEAGPWYGDLYYTHAQYPNDADIQTFSLPTWSNPKFRGEGDSRLQQIKKIISPREWQVRFCGIPAPPKGVVFDEFRARPAPLVANSEDSDSASSPHAICHVTERAEYNPALPVVLFVDPGEVYTVLAGQWVRFEQTRQDTGFPVVMPGLYIFDEIYIPHGWFDKVREELLKKPWFHKVTHTYHDRATIQHHNQKSQGDLWAMPVEDGGLGQQVYYSSQGLGIIDGVNLMKRWLYCAITQEPLIYYHPRCKNAIAEFGKEKWPKDRPTRSHILPIDKDNHARKAVCYGLYYQYGLRLPLEDRVLNNLMKSGDLHRYGY